MSEIIKKFKDFIDVNEYYFPGIGKEVSSKKGVVIKRTSDSKVFFLIHKDDVLAYIPSRAGYPAYYPFEFVRMPEKIKTVLMDLDGTTVRTEEFWIWVIRETVSRLLGDKNFKFSKEDIPHVSGASVSEHLKYCIDKYCANVKGATLKNAWEIYFDVTHSELKAIEKGRGKKDVFKPAPFLKEFLLGLKKKKVRIGLVSSGLYEKAWPEIKSVFDELKLGNPLEFYDAIITAGNTIKKGQAGTLGELEAKPHPWLYMEILNALGADKKSTIGIEDSGSGIIAIRLAGICAIGISGGNITDGGEKPLCNAYFKSLKEVWNFIKNKI